MRCWQGFRLSTGCIGPSLYGLNVSGAIFEALSEQLGEMIVIFGAEIMVMGHLIPKHLLDHGFHTIALAEIPGYLDLLPLDQ